MLSAGIAWYLRFEGKRELVIREGRFCNSNYGVVARRHSLGECVLTTLLKSTFKKKELPYESFSTFLCQTLKRIYPRIVEDNWKRSKCRITTQPVSFHKPNQVSLQVRLLNIGLMEQRLFFLLVWQLQYQHHTFLTVFEHGRKLV